MFAEPGDAEARELLARAYDQLGYQAECGVWRAAYLSGAQELRHGMPDSGGLETRFARGMLRACPSTSSSPRWPRA